MILVLDKESRDRRKKQGNTDEWFTDTELWQADFLAYERSDGDYRVVQSKYGMNEIVDEPTLKELISCHINYFSEGEE